jgi:hypothetical protein
MNSRTAGSAGRGEGLSGFPRPASACRLSGPLRERLPRGRSAGVGEARWCALASEIGSGEARKKGSSSGAALDVDQATRIAQSLLSSPRENVRTRDMYDSGAGYRVARLLKLWLRVQQPASAHDVESLR